ncbi:MAG: hypothetical protein J5741_00315 [Bacteroidales bacterium]|nr:hypothetical protein [Bacteroidales bacterium]
MKAYKIALLLLISAVGFSCAACFPEGGGGLVNPEYRIINVWRLAHAYCDDVEVDTTSFNMDDIYYQAYMPNTLYYIYADHVMNVICSYHGQIRQSTFSTWILDKREKTLSLDYTLLGRHYVILSEIRKLTKNELIIEFEEEGRHWRLEMYSQTGY